MREQGVIKTGFSGDADMIQSGARVEFAVAMDGRGRQHAVGVELVDSNHETQLQ
jgi:hypothetical protein